jgi:hypothetical protein
MLVGVFVPVFVPVFLPVFLPVLSIMRGLIVPVLMVDLRMVH